MPKNVFVFYFFGFNFVLLLMQITQLVAEKDSLIGQIHTAEHTVQQREAEMVHIHQQYQLLYQQFAALQIHYAALEQRLQVLQLCLVLLFSINKIDRKEFLKSL